MAAFDLNLQVGTDLRRDSFLDGTPPDFVATVFDMDLDGLFVLSADGDAWIVRLDSVNAPDPTTEEAIAARENFSSETALQISAGLIQAYTQSVLDETGVEINQAALNAVNAQLQ